MELNLVVHNL